MENQIRFVKLTDLTPVLNGLSIGKLEVDGANERNPIKVYVNDHGDFIPVPGEELKIAKHSSLNAIHVRCEVIPEYSNDLALLLKGNPS